MSMYMLLCNYTEHAVRNMKEMPTRRASANEKAKKLGVEIKAAYLALGVYDLIVHIEAPNEETVAKFVLSLAAMGSLRTTTVRCFPEAEFEKIIGGLV
jgi:uncharacterized protein with GYD domain